MLIFGFINFKYLLIYYNFCFHFSCFLFNFLQNLYDTDVIVLPRISVETILAKIEIVDRVFSELSNTNYSAYMRSTKVCLRLMHLTLKSSSAGPSSLGYIKIIWEQLEFGLNMRRTSSQKIKS